MAFFFCVCSSGILKPNGCESEKKKQHTFHDFITLHISFFFRYGYNRRSLKSCTDNADEPSGPCFRCAQIFNSYCGCFNVIGRDHTQRFISSTKILFFIWILMDSIEDNSINNTPVLWGKLNVKGTLLVLDRKCWAECGYSILQMQMKDFVVCILEWRM